MSTMFWGLRLEPGKRYSTTVDKSFHVSMAALDCSSVKGDDVLSVMLEEDEANVPYILCNLQKQRVMQSRLDLNFMTGDRVTFFCKGHGVVHLSGYIVPDDDEFGALGDEEGEEEAEEEESSSPEIKRPKGAGKVNGIQVSEKRKADNSTAQPKKKKKIANEEADSDDSDAGEEDDDEIGDMDEMDEESDIVDEEDDSDEIDEDENESEEETNAKTELKSAKDKNAQGRQQRQSMTPNAKQQSPGKTPKTSNGLPASNQEQQSGKKEKKKGGETPVGTPKGNKPGAGEASPQKKVLEGGVMVKDLRVGNGPVCKPGRMTSVYYTGRLKSNNKVFDSATQGPGFKFRLGRGEVIKGWDIGVAGMKVGGKRLITCPPAMGYGSKGSPPTIPPNSTLVFEVELKSVN